MATTPAEISPLSIDWEQPLRQTWSSLADFIPKFVVFLVILVIGILIAKAVAKFVGIVLTKVGFEKLLDRSGATQLLAGSDIKPVGLLTKLIYYFILLIALQLALSSFGPGNPVAAIVDDIVKWLPRAVVAIIIVVIAGAVANAVKDVLGSALAGVSYGALLTKIVGGFIVALGVIAALNQIGIGTTVTLPVLIAVLATISGIAIVGVGGGLIGPMARRWDGWIANLNQPASAPRPGVTDQNLP